MKFYVWLYCVYVVGYLMGESLFSSNPNYQVALIQGMVTGIILVFFVRWNRIL